MSDSSDISEVLVLKIKVYSLSEMYSKSLSAQSLQIRAATHYN